MVACMRKLWVAKSNPKKHPYSHSEKPHQSNLGWDWNR